MTQNNYPEGLDELAEELDAKFKPQWASDAARALLDALAERGYVLVDAKKQEPIGEMREGGVVWYGPNPHAFPTGTNFYAAIPGRVALPDGWKAICSPVTEEMHIAATKVLLRSPGLDGLPQRMLNAMLHVAPTPPTQPQGDGSLRLGAEPTEADVLALPIHKNELHEYIASELDRIAADFECRGLYGAKLLRHEASERRALRAEELDAAIDAAMEASNENA